MGKGFLLDKEMLDLLSTLNEEGMKEVVEVLGNLGIEERVITKTVFSKHFDKFKNFLVAETDEIQRLFSGLGYVKEGEIKSESDLSGDVLTGKLKLLSAPAFPQKKVVVKDFVNHFRARYESMKNFLEKRDFENLSSIRKIGNNRGSYTIIAAVMSKRITKNKNLLLEVEDMTGTSIVLVNQNKKEVFEKAKDLLLDDIVAFDVTGTSEMLFANEVVYPEVGLEEKKYSEFDEYVAFISDLHAGSKNFLEKNLLKFIKWLNGEEGDEKQRALALKVKYLFINGDNIDGVSTYPGQENDLNEVSTIGQYKKVEEIFKLVRKDVQMIMGPGQHDTVWIGEPQPIIGERWAQGLCDIENLHLVPNPSLVEIDGGFKILMYHGGSINRLIDEIPYIRTNFGHMSPTTVVKEMLKRRHLAPIHGLMDYIPCENGDPMVIENVPDIITTGDQHRLEISTHNNVLLIASSCWQSITSFEEKVGNVPDPCKVPLFNLKTREIKILDFSDGPVEMEEESKEVIRKEDVGSQKVSAKVKVGEEGG